MKDGFFTIIENTPLTPAVYRLVLGGDVSDITGPGQFVNIKLDGFFLRRPISVCDLSDDKLTIICKKLGRGTEKMAELAPGEKLRVLTGLGNGYDVEKASGRVALIGGGVGIPPLYLLAKRLIGRGLDVDAFFGFNTKEEVFYEKEFKALGCGVRIATADGSYADRGFVTDILGSGFDYFYTCGPEPMLKAVYRATDKPGQFSFERRMGCGFGACMGCSCRTITGYKRICREGPVLSREEILWED